MSKKLIITETEKNRIKELYYLNEQRSKFVDIFMQGVQKGLESDDYEVEDEDITDVDKSIYTDYEKSGDISDFYDITKKIIKNFEGGYWNPECSNYVGSKHPSKTGIYSKSSETMFGLDREAGDIENISPEGKKFFELIDNEKDRMGSMENFCKKWKWNYRGGELEGQLVDLAVKTMKGLFDKNVNRYLSDKAKRVVESSRPLLLHFSYATWNGPGFFKDFAKSINKAIDEGKSESELVEIAKNDRDRRLGGGSWAAANQKVKNLIDQEARNIS